MNEKLKDQDVLLVKEKGNDELKVVKGINPESKKLDTVSPKSENSQDFMKLDKHGSMLENFFGNFSRQFKDPTQFLFFKAPADKAEETAKNLQTALKDPEAPLNKQFLDMHKVEPQEKTQKEHFIDPNLVNWEKFEKFGITREGLEKTGITKKGISNLDRLLDNQKTDLMPVAMKFDEQTLRSDARFSLRKQENGTFSPNVHLIRHKPDLDRPYFGVNFTAEDKQNLLKTGNLGRIVEPEFKQGEKTPVLISLDGQTKEIVAFRKEWLKVPDTYMGVTLNEEQKQKLSEGKAVRVEDMITSEGKKISTNVQFNADKKFFELIFDKKQSQSQKQETGQNETKGVRINDTLLGAKLTEKQQSDLKSGVKVYISGMKDGEGKDFNAYVKVNAKEGKLDFFKYDPDKAKRQGAEATPDNAHKTQVAVNSEGKTNEATKKLNEPLKQGQTQPDEKQEEKQGQKKSRGAKLPF